MSKGASGRKPFERAVIAVIVGSIAFVVVKVATDSNLHLPAGIGFGILAWLITAPPRTEQQKK